MGWAPSPTPWETQGPSQPLRVIQPSPLLPLAYLTVPWACGIIKRPVGGVLAEGKVGVGSVTEA